MSVFREDGHDDRLNSLTGLTHKFHTGTFIGSDGAVHQRKGKSTGKASNDIGD